jgi:hypothetical protein
MDHIRGNPTGGHLQGTSNMVPPHGNTSGDLLQGTLKGDLPQGNPYRGSPTVDRMQ